MEPTNEERAALYEVAQLLGGRESLAGVFEAVVARLALHVPFDFASLMVLDVEPDMERVVGWYPADAMESEDVYPRSRARQMLADRFPEGTEWRPPELPGAAARRMAAGGLLVAWSIPLTDAGEYFGVVTVARAEERNFTEAETVFMRAAGRLFAAAAREERAIWKAERESARSALLTDLMVLLNEGRAAGELFDRLVALLGQAVQFDHASLLRTADDGMLRVVADHPAGARDHVSGPPVPADAAPLAQARAGGERWLQFDPADYDSRLSRALLADGLRRCNVVFLQHRARLVGAIVLSRTSPRPFAADDCEFLSLAAALLAQAIVNRETVDRELDATRRDVEEQRLITEVAAIAAEEGDSAAMLARARDAIRRMVPGVDLAFAIRTPEEVHVVRASASLLTLPADALTVRAAPLALGVRELFGPGYEIVHTSFMRSAGAQGGVLVAAVPGDGFRPGDREVRILDLAAQFIGWAMQTRQTLVRLEQGRELLDFVLGTLTDGIALLDNKLEPAFANDRGRVVANALSGVSRDWPAGSRDLALALQPALAQLRADQGEIEVEVDGEPRLHRYELLPVDHPAYSVLVRLSDIHEQRAHEREQALHQQQMEQAARLAAVGELVAGVAHELNNPLTAILGFTELLNGPETPDWMREDLGLVYKEASRARDIVRDLLMLVRPGQASQDRLTLDGLLGHIRRLRDAAWRKQGIEVELDVRDGDTPVYANEHQVTQVLLNLVTNAEQALAGRSGSRLALRAWLEAESALLEVEDNGPGMDPALLSRIWEPFFTTKQGVGTGLGLPLSRSIVDGHGGTLTVNSRPGKGTCFRVSIPRNTVRSAGAAVAAAPSRYRVLVVDDEPNLRKLARRMVEALGHECDVAEGVADAKELAARYQYDLLLCDYRIAAAVADDVVEALVEIAPALIARTVIATGAISDSGVDDLAGRFGLRVLGKPYGMEEIAGLLGSLDRAA